MFPLIKAIGIKFHLSVTVIYTAPAARLSQAFCAKVIGREVCLE